MKGILFIFTIFTVFAILSVDKLLPTIFIYLWFVSALGTVFYFILKSGIKFNIKSFKLTRNKKDDRVRYEDYIKR